MRMISFRPVAALGLTASLAAAAPAAAAPSFTLQHEAATPLDRLGASVVSRLGVTGSAVEERFHLSSAVPVTFSGDIRVERETSVGAGVASCGTRWERSHSSRPPRGRWDYDVVVPAGGRATVQGVD